MGDFGTFGFSEDVYGVPSDLTLESVDIITPTLIKLNFNKEVLVNNLYLDPANYSLLLFNSITSDAVVREVLTPFVPTSDASALVARHSLIVTDALTIGLRYTFMVNNLVDRTGVSITPSMIHRYARRTKTQGAIRSLSSGYDMRSESTTFNILAAITRSDDLIGGTEEEIILKTRLG